MACFRPETIAWTFQNKEDKQVIRYTSSCGNDEYYAYCVPHKKQMRVETVDLTIGDDDVRKTAEACERAFAKCPDCAREKWDAEHSNSKWPEGAEL